MGEQGRMLRPSGWGSSRLTDELRGVGVGEDGSYPIRARIGDRVCGWRQLGCQAESEVRGRSSEADQVQLESMVQMVAFGVMMAA